MTDDRMWRPGGEDLWLAPRTDESEPTDARADDRADDRPDVALVDAARPDQPRLDGVRLDAAFDGSESSDDRSDDAPHRRRSTRRSVAAVAVVTSIAAMAVAVASSSPLVRPTLDGAIAEPEPPPVLTPFGGADPRRLPEAIASEWTLGIPLSADVGTTMIAGNGLLVVTLPAPERCLEPDGRCAELPDRLLERSRTAIAAVDVDAGTRAWTVHVPLETHEIDLLGVVSGVAVVELRTANGRTVVGLDAADGDERWRLERDGAETFEILPGTSVVTRSTFGSRPMQEFIDPADGSVLDRIDGTFVATDHSGRWWVRRRGATGDSLSLVDLSDRLRSPTPADRLPTDVDLSDIDLSDIDVATVVDGRPIGVVDGGIVLHDERAGWQSVEVRAPERFRTDGGDVEANVDSPPLLRLPGSIIGFAPTSGADFAFTGDGSVYGATLVDDDDGRAIDVRWQLRGVIAESAPPERGQLLVVASQGGAALRVVDGVSGSVLADVQMYVGVLDSLRLVGDGFVTKRAAEVGVELAAIGLDGDDRWTLVGSDPFAVGDGVVVTRTDTDDGVRLTGYRDPDG